MSVALYLNFKNQAKEAISFYEKVFNTKCTGIMLYGQHPTGDDNPSGEEFELPEEAKDLVMNANLNVHGTNVMFSDIPDGMGMEHIVGNNITIVIDIADEALLDQQFNALAENGIITMPLQETFWAKKYGNLVDQYGVGWQFNLSNDK